ncbi:hypothetical protein PTT_08265 [Pyrenophora teres f. teres 0-1]|uniref:F-box domain-containing protein n=2 Tax=Pyrenophora teres f. teres TaxID=97479 RepID=E3RJE2_PYRTT|nr:hypothetical protein PTT_08265 [Pyrenophora teres f. teres 0-1]KAE8829263.1 hypothetical protein PTNB85_08451 [Pyrenophora teres f. teres]KAE8830425.1 hypothetical protein HRS9139_07049 [Pyrenophora teres f. teres]KAE8841239.1 hypothetical protein HRS9122_05365 [Pyrenophora teres f. teres]KAE8859340.1 hypothetical protein PTNB29_06571 [Pyrenophora teres f. teres]
MAILRKRCLFTEASDSEQEQGNTPPPICSLRKVPQFRHDSESDVNNTRFESPGKRMRRVHNVASDPVPASHIAPAAASTLRIPPELILAVLQYADPAEIAGLRLLSSGIKKDIDTYLLHHTVQRVELIGYLGPKKDRLLERLASEDYWGFALLVEREGDEDDEPGNGLFIRATNWKLVLMNFFREERALKSLMEETKEDEYTYNHLEDSLRHIRRKRFRSKLDKNHPEDCRTIWKIDHMSTLWNKHTYFLLEGAYRKMELAERYAVRTLMLLRKEASMPNRKRDALNKIVAERAAMRKGLQQVDQLFKNWQEHLLALPYLSLERLHLDEDFDSNPLTWSKRVIYRELDSLTRWKRQKPVIEPIASVLDAANAAATLDEAAFDDDGSEYDF